MRPAITRWNSTPKRLHRRGQRSRFSSRFDESVLRCRLLNNEFFCGRFVISVLFVEGFLDETQAAKSEPTVIQSNYYRVRGQPNHRKYLTCHSSHAMIGIRAFIFYYSVR
jgi:hypothetical protein